MYLQQKEAKLQPCTQLQMCEFDYSASITVSYKKVWNGCPFVNLISHQFLGTMIVKVLDKKKIKFYFELSSQKNCKTLTFENVRLPKFKLI